MQKPIVPVRLPLTSGRFRSHSIARCRSSTVRFWSSLAARAIEASRSPSGTAPSRKKYSTSSATKPACAIRRVRCS